MEKKIIIILICLTILGGSLSSVFAESASFQTFSEDEIKNADKYIINHNNQLVINNKNALIREVGTQKYSLIVNDLELCNYLISNGKISIKKNGTLYINDDDSLTIQGGNINATRLYWWGWHRYNDNRNTKNIIKEFRKQSKFSNNTDYFWGFRWCSRRVSAI